MKVVNAVGKACPMPVIMAKKEIDQKEETFLVLVDNKIVVENLKKLAASQGFDVSVKEEGENYQVSFAKGCEACDEILKQYSREKETEKEAYTVFIGKEYVGDGDQTLGRSLMKMFLYTLSESEQLPESILLMNGGVKLAVEDENCIENLRILNEKNVNILVCGTCLNYYEITEKLQVGTVSNMYDIVTKMQNAKKVITV